MRAVTVDTATKTVTAQGGCRWKDVDTALAKHELATVGGTVNDTGIGGLSLGGGYGFLVGQYGLVVDNILDIELVLADGSVKRCNASENSDLFWALRGAGANYGIATSITYQAHDQTHDVWAGLLSFPKEKVRDIFEVANQLAKVGDGRGFMLPAFVTSPPSFKVEIIAVVFFNGSKEEAMTFFKPLLALGPVLNTASSIPYWKSNEILNDVLPSGYRRTFKGSSTLAPISIDFAEDMLREFEEFVTKVPDAKTSFVYFENFPTQKTMEVIIQFSSRLTGRTCTELTLMRRTGLPNVHSLCKPRRRSWFTDCTWLDRQRKRYSLQRMGKSNVYQGPQSSIGEDG